MKDEFGKDTRNQDLERHTKPLAVFNGLEILPSQGSMYSRCSPVIGRSAPISACHKLLVNPEMQFASFLAKGMITPIVR